MTASCNHPEYEQENPSRNFKKKKQKLTLTVTMESNRYSYWYSSTKVFFGLCSVFISSFILLGNLGERRIGRSRRLSNIRSLLGKNELDVARRTFVC